MLADYTTPQRCVATANGSVPASTSAGTLPPPNRPQRAAEVRAARGGVGRRARGRPPAGLEPPLAAQHPHRSPRGRAPRGPKRPRSPPHEPPRQVGVRRARGRRGTAAVGRRREQTPSRPRRGRRAPPRRARPERRHVGRDEEHRAVVRAPAARGTVLPGASRCRARRRKPPPRPTERARSRSSLAQRRVRHPRRAQRIERARIGRSPRGEPTTTAAAGPCSVPGEMGPVRARRSAAASVRDRGGERRGERLAARADQADELLDRRRLLGLTPLA